MSKDGPAEPTLRPVRVDQQGRVFYIDSGKQIIIPGLEPETILQGIAEAEAGHWQTLNEVMEELKKDNSQNEVNRKIFDNMIEMHSKGFRLPSTAQSDTPDPPTGP